MTDGPYNQEIFVKSVRAMMSQNNNNMLSDLDLITAGKGACRTMAEPGGMNSLIDLLKGHKAAGRTNAYTTQYVIFFTATQTFCGWASDEWTALSKDV
jgi:hypothetical protein